MRINSGSSLCPLDCIEGCVLSQDEELGAHLLLGLVESNSNAFSQCSSSLVFQTCIGVQGGRSIVRWMEAPGRGLFDINWI
jgi:hypothetical protein